MCHGTGKRLGHAPLSVVIDSRRTITEHKNAGMEMMDLEQH